MIEPVDFTPHPCSLEGTLPPSSENEEKFGFSDIPTMIVSTMKVAQNAPKGKWTNITHGEVAALVKKTIYKENKTLDQKMQKELRAFKKEIVKEANIHI